MQDNYWPQTGRCQMCHLTKKLFWWIGLWQCADCIAPASEKLRTQP